jgi:hypothetical protein
MRRNISLLASLVFVAFFLPKKSAAQNDNPDKVPTVNIVSPTASSLGKYVDFPVNLHSGVPEIGIPIYTVQKGPLSLPISLSYHASGLQVAEPASWVGAGWSLQAGGVVSRNAKGGNPDERKGYQNKTFWDDNGFSNYFFTTSPWGDLVNDYDRFLQGYKDGEPDLYTFSFGNYSGKFYFREDHSVVLIPETDLKIELIEKSGGNLSYDYFQGFIITDADGIKYYFGVTADATDIDPIEKSRIWSNEVLETYQNVISSWYLNKIESADGLFHINLSYRKEDFGYYTLSTKPCIPNCNGSVKAMKIGMSGVALDEITFTDGRVKFIANTSRQDLSKNSFAAGDEELNTEAKSLDEIHITSNDLSHQVRYKFTYSYFEDQSTQPLPYVIQQHWGQLSTDRKRLKLDSLQMFGPDDVTKIPPYKFFYYDQNRVPRRLSFGVDHWGYANDVTTNETLIPPISVDGGVTYGNGDNREANWPAMRAGSLYLIQTPTGGCTEYRYEPNSATTSSFRVPSQESKITSMQAGMGTSQEEFSAIYTLVVPTPAYYYYDVYAYGSGAVGVPGGTFLIDNVATATVTAPNNSNKHQFVFLQAGTHTLQVHANADNGSGEGILAHFYNADPQVEKMVGGLRIKRISKFGEKNSPKLSMSYEYVNAKLYSIPVYALKMRNDTFKGSPDFYGTTKGCLTYGSNSSTYVWYTSPTSILPLHTVQGYHIGYGTVKEIHQDGGYSVYEYYGNVNLPGNWNDLEDVCVRKINASVCTDADPIYPAAPLPFDFERGHLKSQRIYTNADQLVKEINNTEQHTESDLGIFGLQVGAYSYQINQQTYITQLPTHYDIRTSRLDWTKTVEKTYDEAGNSLSTESSTYFNSAYHDLPSRRIQTSQNGTSQVDYLYPGDMTKCNYDYTSPCAAAYLTAAEQLRIRYEALLLTCEPGGVCITSDFKGWAGPIGPCSNQTGTPQCKSIAYADYLFRLNEARITYTNCILNNSTSNLTCTTSGLNNSSDPSAKALYRMELSHLLKPIESTSWKENVFQSSTYFDYLAEPVTNRIYLKNVFSTKVGAPTSTFAPAVITVAYAVQRDSKYETDPVSVFKFAGGQPVEIKNRNGSMTSYIWGFNNTLPVVKAEGVEHSVLQTAYDNPSGNLRDNVYAAQPVSQVTTYEYKQLRGISTIMDANGRKISYDYDKLGRLQYIKDHELNILEQYEYTYQID